MRTASIKPVVDRFDQTTDWGHLRACVCLSVCLSNCPMTLSFYSQINWPARSWQVRIRQNLCSQIHHPFHGVDEVRDRWKTSSFAFTPFLTYGDDWMRRRISFKSDQLPDINHSKPNHRALHIVKPWINCPLSSLEPTTWQLDHVAKLLIAKRKTRVSNH